eukprot:Seg1569.9 transcript_id=Seg1569.9/GoldUCD/mRNA.D3Y31 product=Tenascin-X protein_id=Seg1569.9/GoldUCD/D3Y31
MKIIQFVTSLTLWLFSAGSSEVAAKGVWFQEITGNVGRNQDGHGTMTSFFSKHFHKCNINKQCKFVLRDLKTDEHREVTNEDDLPQNIEGYQIWKKIEEKVLRSCKDMKEQGFTINGVYDLQRDNGTTVKAYCDMTTNNGGWTVLQRRVNAAVSFDRDWAAYVMGFGNPSGNHWLGLEAMHQLTKEGNVTLRFDLKHSDGSVGFAEYDKFTIAAASENYKIQFSRYKGNIGDALTSYAKGQPFTTKDKDNDLHFVNCATEFKGAWWHAYCFGANLNSIYPGSQPSTISPLFADTMSWYTWKNAFGRIMYSEMKLPGSSEVAAKGVWFQEITSNVDRKQDGHGTMTSFFSKHFHKCSMKKQCQFVLRDLKTNEHREVTSENDLPQNRDGYQIWKKIEEKGKKIEEKGEKTEEKVAELRSCKDLKEQGFTINGVYDLQHDNGKTLKAYCDMTTNNGGWTVLQRRVNATVSFDRDWAAYVMGFGNPSGNHWLGLEAMHQLTKEGNVTLRFDLKHSDGSVGFAEYDKFTIAAASENYTIQFSRYKGNIGDALAYHKGQQFSTKDKDNDSYMSENCAALYKGAWWYSHCFNVNLNNIYPRSQPAQLHETMSWYTWKNAHGGIVYSEMKLRKE